MLRNWTGVSTDDLAGSVLVVEFASAQLATALKGRKGKQYVNVHVVADNTVLLDSTTKIK
jgi:hypothetical protein